MSTTPGTFDFDSKWDYSDPAATEATFREMLEQAEDDDYRLVLQTQIARTLGLQQKYEQAHALLDGLGEVAGFSPLVQARFGLEKGRVYNSSNQADKAIPHFEAALEAASGNGFDYFAVDAAHMLGIAATGERATEWNLKAQSLAEQSTCKAARGWLGSLYNNTGWAFHDKGDLDQAMDQFKKALAHFKEVAPGSGRESIARWTVARCLRSQGEFETALAEQRAMFAEKEAKGESDGFISEEIAECLHALGEVAEAKPWFARAFEALSQDKWLQQDEPERIERMKQLAE